MRNGFWNRGGPRVLGYEPGWLWWAAALVLLVAAAFFIEKQVRQLGYNRAYIAERIAHHAEDKGLDVVLVESVVEAESGGDWQAESPVGAKGLMQITPIAHEDVRLREGIGGGDLFAVDYNLEVGTLYLRYLLDRFDGDVTLALAAYHMGPTKVSKGLKQHPNLSSQELVKKLAGPQTRAYVARVLELYEAQSR